MAVVDDRGSATILRIDGALPGDPVAVSRKSSVR
jgi:hypothetical protein